jgi:ankyrin repeat protein
MTLDLKSLLESIRKRTTQGGETALICAAYEGHIDCVRLLVEAGADKNAKSNVRACHSFPSVYVSALQNS